MLHHARTWIGPVTVAGAAGAAAALVLQVAYNRWASGRLTLSSYGDSHFTFDRPMQASVLALDECGWRRGTPLRSWSARRAGGPSHPPGGAGGGGPRLLAYAGVYGFWHSSFLGGGFGYRGFVDLVPLAAVTGAVAWSQLPRRALVATAAAAAVATLATVSLMLGYWRGTVPFQGTQEVQRVQLDHLVGDESLYTP